MYALSTLFTTRHLIQQQTCCTQLQSGLSPILKAVSLFVYCILYTPYIIHVGSLNYNLLNRTYLSYFTDSGFTIIVCTELKKVPGIMIQYFLTNIESSFQIPTYDLLSHSAVIAHHVYYKTSVTI